MKTLREMSLYAVVKFGVGTREDLPDKLPGELRDMEERIGLDIGGDYYYWFVPPCHMPSFQFQLNVGWARGEWSFVMWVRGSPSVHQYTMQIRAGRRNQLGHE